MGIEPATYRSHKSETKRQARQALHELTEVAESPAVDHTEVFDPDDVFRLLQALLTANWPHHYATDDLPTVVTDDHLTDEFVAYKDDLYVQLDQFSKFRQRQR